MTTDIFKFWSEATPDDNVHPRDREVLLRVAHGFNLKCLPTCFRGPLRTAPVVLLYLAPGLSEQDPEDATSPTGRDRYARTWRGYEPLPGPDDHRKAWRWWSDRTQIFGEWAKIRSKVAVLNIGCYHSRKSTDKPLLAALPSSRVSVGWAQSVLFPQAIDGERVVVCLRSARFWGLAEGRQYGRALFAPAVTRGGHMKRDGPMRANVIAAVTAAIARPHD